MKTIKIAFDVDGTLRDNTTPENTIKANEDVRSLLVLLSKFKNTKIIVWSGSGELYARQVAASIGIDPFVDKYATKNYIGKEGDEHQFAPEFVPDIAIDDIQACELGVINLIVREK